MHEMMEWVRYSNSVGFCFQGRARRREYGWNFLFWGLVILAANVGTIVLGMVLPGSMFGLAHHNGVPGIYRILMMFRVGFLLVIMIWKLVPIEVRRFHDRGLSGWIYLLCLTLAFVCGIGNIARIVIWCMDSQPGSNQYGPNPKEQ